ncbi:uncharacterized protein G2W53_010942 [Senna tora]|uniref:Uncharacterized protein n=1 Tax=Senna tora TaxID=362788 RepID=A0A834X1Z3_9FABA|nr:uncharacterized protein G2W53_010942 [Senna tora]
MEEVSEGNQRTPIVANSCPNPGEVEV